MSAFMVSKTHIDSMVATALHGPIGEHERYSSDWMSYSPKYCPRWDEDDSLGDMLVEENLSSIHYRYPDTVENPEDTPGPLEQYWLEDYKFPVSKIEQLRMTIPQAFKAIDCYEYQSCEHPQWKTSQAHDFCQQFRKALIGSIPGYNSAEWGIDD